MRTIFAMGGGGFTMEPDNTVLDEFILGLARRPMPRVCFLPTASGDPLDHITRFYEAFSDLPCEPTDLSLFRLGRYYDPYGWNYSRFSIGFNLWPSYYGSSFWLNDPWQYRLPPAYGPYRWVRYYDDALLVNIYDGQVVDVIHNFFW